MAHSPQVPVKDPYDPSRIAFTIPNFEQFGELLHDRFHAVVYHFEEIENKFMLITNLFDRDPVRIAKKEAEGAQDVEAITYCGTKKQRRLLELDEPEYLKKRLKNKFNDSTWHKERNGNWGKLRNRELDRNMKEIETFGFFDAFRKGELGLDAIKVGALADYFKVLDNELQENEYPIISDYFDIEQDKYIGIPLLGMGLFQGIVWIVFNHVDQEVFQTPKSIRKLIKLFEYEYDHLILSWDLTEANINRKSLVGDSIKEVKVTNPIQIECNTKRYYEISQDYFNTRVELNNLIVGRLRDQYQKSSIITILLDSFAHNISAHSLTTLGWWFREQAEYLRSVRDGSDLLSALGRDANPLIVHAKQFPEGGLSNELHRLFKFLLEKGAFWSAITRQTNFAGKISSLYNILWHDFIHNALYLGTIANTEEVKKIKINITIYENESRVKDSKFLNKKTVKKAANGKLLDGTLAIVNLEDVQKKELSSAESIFVEKGALYEELKIELERQKAFFPGGIVGKHAFFTLLENEIRNVKHFKGEVLKSIQRDGLILNISIHERPVDSDKTPNPHPNELLKIGVWLKHAVHIDEDLLVKRIKDLDADVVNEETFQPRLGGNYQDKICASMLMTNSFSKVQDKESALGEIYYPWIKAAACKIRKDKAVFQEFEVSQRRFKDAKFTIDKRFSAESGEGYFKKYFHLWKGAELVAMTDFSTATDMSLENPARFKFLHLAAQASIFKSRSKVAGLIRILNTDKKISDISSAYKYWLPCWLKNEGKKQDTLIDFIEGETNTGRIVWEKGKLTFTNYRELRKLSKEENDRSLKIANRFEIAIEHGSKLTASPDKFNYRTHGEFLTTFCEGIPLPKVTKFEESKLYELFECLVTRVSMFDRRIYSRMCASESQLQNNHDPEYAKKVALQLARLNLYRRQLSLDFRNETIEHWEEVKRQGFLNQHFVIVHLSFMENMGYPEDQILQFIDQEILCGLPPEKVGDNFVLVITTGRGRVAWWDKIISDRRYARFCTFRPIESILGAVEDALELPDDINLKYNLTKLLFGS